MLGKLERIEGFAFSYRGHLWNNMEVLQSKAIFSVVNFFKNISN